MCLEKIDTFRSQGERTRHHAERAEGTTQWHDVSQAQRLADIYLEAHACCASLCGYTALLGMIGGSRSADLPAYHDMLAQIAAQEQHLARIIQLLIVDAERDSGDESPPSWPISDDLEEAAHEIAEYQTWMSRPRMWWAYAGAHSLLNRLRSDLAVLTAIHDPLSDPLPQPYQTILQRIERTAQKFLLIFQILGRDAKH